MNDLEYLNQIAMANRPVKQKGKGLAAIFSSTIAKIVAAGVGLLIFVVILGSMLGGVNAKERNLLIQINTRMNNLQSTITSFNSSVKSARLRGMGVSLSSTLAESSRDLFAVLAGNYDYEAEAEIDASVTDEEAAHLVELKTVLENAKLNGILDRTYVHRLAYETTLLIAMESEALERSSDDAVRTILGKSMGSLRLLEEQLSNYSDSTN